MKRSFPILAALALALCAALLLPAASPGDGAMAGRATPHIVQLTPLPPGYWIRYVDSPNQTTDYAVVAIALLDSGQTWPLILKSTGFILAPEGWLGFCYVPEERGCWGVEH